MDDSALLAGNEEGDIFLSISMINSDFIIPQIFERDGEMVSFSCHSQHNKAQISQLPSNLALHAWGSMRNLIFSCLFHIFVV